MVCFFSYTLILVKEENQIPWWKNLEAQERLTSYATHMV